MVQLILGNFVSLEMFLATVGAVVGGGLTLHLLLDRIPARERRSRPWQGIAITAGMTVLLLPLTAALFARGRWGWAFLAASWGLMSLLAALEGLLAADGSKRKTLALLLAWTAACGVAFSLGRERLRSKLAHQESEEALARLIALARRPWTTGPGVAELRDGPLVAWLAVPSPMAVDWEYERELGAQARRSVPLRVVALNDTFSDLAAALGPLWRLRVAAGARTLREWEAPPYAEGLGPAERRDFTVPWDGRDSAGALLAPGDYRVLLEFQGPGGSRQAELPLRVEDAGPVVEVTPDPSAENLQRRRELDELSRILSNGLQQLQLQRSQQFQMNELRRLQEGRP